jgi:hypothetical protein
MYHEEEGGEGSSNDGDDNSGSGNEGLKAQLVQYERQAEVEKAARRLIDSRVGVNFESTLVREMK